MYCLNVAGLLQAMGCVYDPTEWRLFIDSSKANLKCVLLHNGNRYASMPLFILSTPFILSKLMNI